MIREELSIEELTRIIEKGVAYRARKRLLSGNWKNPYRDCDSNSMERGMFDWYEREIERFKSERLCPCCGQFTCGDIDF